MKDKYLIITFDTTHKAMAADSLLTAKDVEHKFMAIPQEISAGCGFCLGAGIDKLDYLKQELKNAGILASGFYYVEKNGLNRNITRLGE